MFWNDSQSAPVWADHDILGAHNLKPLLGSRDRKIGRHMPNIPKTGNAQGMPLLALFLNAVFEIERAYHQ